MSFTAFNDRVTEYSPVVATAEFTADFEVFDNSDLIVVHDGVERTDFTVTASYIDGVSTDAKCVFATGITGDVKVVGYRDPRRSSVFNDGLPVTAKNLNYALTQRVSEAMELKRDLSRTILMPLGVAGMILTASANTVLAWSADGQLVNRTITTADVLQNTQPLNADDGFSFDTTKTPTQSWRINDIFVASYTTVHKFETTDLAVSTPVNGRSTAAFSRRVKGAGATGVGKADIAAHFVVEKDGFLATGVWDVANTTVGEVDSVKMNAFGDGRTDMGVLLIGAYQREGDGTIDDGGVTTIEIGANLVTDVSYGGGGGLLLTTSQEAHGILGFIPNPAGGYATVNPNRGIVMYWAEARKGTGHAAFGAVEQLSGTGETWRHVFLAEKTRGGDEQWSLKPDGSLNVANYDGGAGAGPDWLFYRKSASAATNDVLTRFKFRGRNAANTTDIDYASEYVSIKQITAGAEIGSRSFFAAVNGATVQQLRIENGIVVATGGATLAYGSGTLSLQSALYINNVQLIGSDGGYRNPVFAGSVFASKASAINTTGKVKGKQAVDGTNNRILIASGSADVDPWYRADGTLAVTPA